MSSDSQTKICLGVAVDHRIQRLCKTTSHGLGDKSNHVSSIKEEGRVLQRSRDEISVTAQLAGPAYKGGIAVVLQQPRNNHPFTKGIDAVIEDCESLMALYEVFCVASRGSLDIRTNVSVVDLLPFVPNNVSSLSDGDLTESFKATTQIICDKEPDVLLCAGKIWLSRAGKFDDRKGDAWKFESVGLGTQFGSTPKLPVVARVRHGSRGLVSIPRVNGFHPSHAMNYLSHVSLLRQLQILIAAETCGTLRGDWEDEDWMGDIRKRCQSISQSLTGHSPSKSASLQSPSQSSGTQKRKYVPEWQVMFADNLLDLKTDIISLLANHNMAKKSPGAPYRTLLAKRLSETCNDVTLILRQISRCVEKGWPASVAWKNEASLKELSSETLLFAQAVLKVVKTAQSSQFAKIIKSTMTDMIDLGKPKVSKKTTYKYGIEPTELSKAFLKLATKIETLLLDLLVEKEDALNALGQEEYLSGLMSRVSLTPSTNPKEYRRSSEAVRSGRRS